MGKVMSLEWRRKQSEAKKRNGTRPPVLTSEQLRAYALARNARPPSRLGTKASEETRAKMRASARRGALNNNWKGGVSDPNRVARKSREFDEWRERVFKRDNWTCQKYGTRGVKLHPHHILNFAEYPKLRFKVSNGIALSEKAHNEFHRIYGKRGNTRAQLREFLGSGQ